MRRVSSSHREQQTVRIPERFHWCVPYTPAFAHAPPAPAHAGNERSGVGPESESTKIQTGIGIETKPLWELIMRRIGIESRIRSRIKNIPFL
ncbi:hypothetical protein EVAR_11434_1 [Eumeta japonica]|uniref:Uncharacterized protein n=1 Tax=Eumeta variegata TaxID=151549 RepID=A0A4C1TM41_EUMVA|nr:hypothetical protein EVAR_11434_1 [Eumeta japonica]